VDVDYDGVADAEQSSSLGDSCIAHDDCALGDVCDFSIYSCVGADVLSSETCRSSSECSDGGICYNRYCIPEMVGEGEVHAGITPDNPFLGLTDDSIDKVRLWVSNNPDVLAQITKESLSESRSLDERKAEGVVSGRRYVAAKHRVGKRTVQSVEKGYNAIRRRSIEGNTEGLQVSLQQMHSLADRTEKDLSTFSIPPDQSEEFSPEFTGLHSRLADAQQQFAISAMREQSQIYSCDSFDGDITLGDFVVHSLQDGSLSFVDSSGSSYSLSSLEDGLVITGSSVSVYMEQEVYSGKKIVFSLFTEETFAGESDQELEKGVEYEVYVDGKYVGTRDLNQYGKSLLGLGNSVLYMYEVSDGNVRLLLGDRLFISVDSFSVETCQLSMSIEESVSEKSQSDDEVDEEIEIEEIQDTFTRSSPSNKTEIRSQEQESGYTQNIFGNRTREGVQEREGRQNQTISGSRSQKRLGPTGKTVYDVSIEYIFSFWRFLFLRD